MNDATRLEDTLPPEVTSRYSEIQAVGQGGMGRILSAFDTVLQKKVALKLLPVSVLSATAVVRFQQEARAVSKLNHMHVVQVLDFAFTSTGEPVLIMEYIDGEDLDSIIEREVKIGLKRAVEIAIQICKGLEHAHSNGVIHRDLKPHNVMLDKSGTVRILDFGLARIMDQSEVDWRLTRPGQFLGTPLYMSPEQIRGQSADERSDVYGLGLLIFKMVTGSIPHEKENIIAMMRTRLEEPAPNLEPNTEFPEMGAALDAIIQKCLNLEVEDRFESMAHLGDALNELSSLDEKPAVEETKKERGNFKFGRLDVVLLGLFCFFAITSLFIKEKMREVNQAPLPKPAPLGALPVDAEAEKKNSEQKTKKAPVVATVQNEPGSRLPLGFTEEFQRNRSFWVAKDYLQDQDLKRLIGTDVKFLSLDINKNLTVEGIKLVSTLPLRALLLRDTQIDDSSLKYINRLRLLEWLDLRGTNVTDRGLAELDASDNLIGLDLNYDPGITDKSVLHIVKSFPRMKHLTLSNTKVTIAGIKKLMPLKLYGLALAALNLTDDDMDTLVKLGISSTDLEGNIALTDAGIKKLEKLKNLSWLGIEQCPQVSKAALASLKKRFPKITLRQDTDRSLVDEMTENLLPEP